MDVPTSEPEGGSKRLVEIRCGFAEMARKEAEFATTRVREAWASYDQQAAVVTRAQSEIDLAGIRAGKEEAHRAFRSTVAAAQSRGQVEDAAAKWLAEINQVNGSYRLAQATIQRELDVAESLLAELTKLFDAAEASATMAEAAMHACREAEAALAAANAGEGQAPEPPPVPARDPTARDVALPDNVSPQLAAGGETPPIPASPPAVAPESGRVSVAPGISVSIYGDEDEPPPDALAIDLRAPNPQAITRLLRRDSGTMTTLVDRLAGSDPAERSHWQLLLSTFVDALVAAAIDDAWFEFPEGNPFWGQFPQDQAREIVRNLAAVGFRYDGFGAFVDDRVPDQRDFAMAIGGAGLLPMRVHVWPRPDEAARLFNDLRVLADEFVALRAPAMTLGQLLSVIGRRADLLADLWNQWPRVRPLLFATHL